MPRSTEQRLRLAYVTTVPATQFGFLRGQNAYMAERGFELHAVSTPEKWLDLLAERDGVLAHALPIARDISPGRDLISLWKLYVLLRRLRPDVLHVSTPKAALLGALAGWAARIPVRVFLVRGLTCEGTRGLKRWMFRHLERLTARLCHTSICVSHSLLDYARRAKILRENEGTVIANGMSNGVDAQRFDPARIEPADLAALRPDLKDTLGRADTVVIGFVGRLGRDKGIEDLADAWQTLRETHPNTVLLLVGRFQDFDGVAEAVRQRLDADPRVILPGSVEDPAPYYRSMDVFVYPSHGTEGFPNAPMEARAMELPVVATRVVGCVDAVEDGQTGTLVPPCDVAALTTALHTYVDDRELRRRHGRAGRAGVLRDYQPEAIWDGMYQTYVELLEGNGISCRRPAEGRLWADAKRWRSAARHAPGARSAQPVPDGARGGLDLLEGDK